MGQFERYTHRTATAALLADAALCPADAKGTAAAFQPRFRWLSPCLGLLALNAPNLVTNLHSVGVRPPQLELQELPAAEPAAAELDAAASLAAELYFQPGGREHGPGLPPARACRNRSRPSSWLGVGTLGSLLGQSVRQLEKEAESAAGAETQKAVDARLRSIGIATNKVDGVKTGVSMTRHRKLALDLLAALRTGGEELGKSGPPALGLLLLLRLVWERAAGKECLLDFQLAVDRELGGRALALPADARAGWVASRFGPAELGPRELEVAAAGLLAEEAGAARIVQHLELLASGLSSAAASKPRLPAGRYGWAGGEPRPDCVEVVVREILDLLLYEPTTGKLELELLPPGASPALIAFYHAGLVDGQVPRGGIGIPVHSVAGQRWFDLCQSLAGVPYLSASGTVAGGGDARCDYEAAPTLQGVARICQHLLQGGGGGAETAGGGLAGWQGLEDLAEWWNSLQPLEAPRLARPRLTITTSRTVHRVPHGEVSKGAACARCARCAND